jgi:hypothetical protein
MHALKGLSPKKWSSRKLKNSITRSKRRAPVVINKNLLKQGIYSNLPTKIYN